MSNIVGIGTKLSAVLLWNDWYIDFYNNVKAEVIFQHHVEMDMVFIFSCPNIQL